MRFRRGEIPEIPTITAWNSMIPVRPQTYTVGETQLLSPSFFTNTDHLVVFSFYGLNQAISAEPSHGTARSAIPSLGVSQGIPLLTCSRSIHQTPVNQTSPFTSLQVNNGRFCTGVSVHGYPAVMHDEQQVDIKASSLILGTMAWNRRSRRVLPGF